MIGSHDVMQNVFTRKFIQEVRGGTSPFNEIFSTNVHLTDSYGWPRPDFIISDSDKNIECAFEFKPEGHGKREYITGVGQAISYIDGYAYSAVVLPEKANDEFKIGQYVGDLLGDVLFKDLPLSVIEYTSLDRGRIDFSVIKDLSLRKTQIRQGSQAVLSRSLWAPWREMSRHELYLMLELSEKYRHDDEINIKGIVFNELWDDVLDGETLSWQGTPRAIGIKGGGENRTSNQMNYCNFVNHLGLWDPWGRLTSNGLRLLSVGRIHDYDSAEFVDYLAKLVLEDGKHLMLISAIEEFQEESYRDQDVDTRKWNQKNLSNKYVYHVQLEEYLDEKGYLQRMPGRRTTSGRNLLQSELTIWNYLGLIEKFSNQYLFPDVGLKFNWQRISNLLSKEFGYY